MASPQIGMAMSFVGGFAPRVMPPPKIRKEFPETWLWESSPDTGYAEIFTKRHFGFHNPHATGFAY